MDSKSMDQLRLDRRLAGRRGWISEDELAEEAAKLPDSAEKVAPKESETDDEDDAPLSS